MKHLLQIGLLLLSAGTLWAQGPSPMTVYRPGELPPVETNAEDRGISFMQGQLKAGVTYDNNVVGSGQSQPSGTKGLLEPAFTLEETRPRTVLRFNYDGSLRLDPKKSSRDLLSNSLNGELAYQFTKHLGLNLHENFVVTNDPFSTGASAGSVGNPNVDFAHSQVTRYMNLTNAEVTDNIGVHTSLLFTGSFADESYSRTLQQIGALHMIDSATYTGSGAFIHAFSARHTLTAMYQYQDLTFARVKTAHTTSNTILLADTIKVNSRNTLQIFAGPEMSYTHDQVMLTLFGGIIVIPVEKGDNSWTAGGVYTYTRPRWTLRASTSRRVSDGGGIFAAVRVIDVTGELRYELTHTINLQGEMKWGTEHLLNVPLAAGIDVTTIDAGVTKKLTENIDLEAHYARVSEDRVLVGFPGTGPHNRITVTVNYKFKRPLGF